MEVETAHPPSTSGSLSVACYPRWVIFERYGKSTVDDDLSCAKADAAKTLAAARTSRGHLLQVSLCLAEPPATSAVLVEFPDGGVLLNYCLVLAAHGDSLLLVVKTNQQRCDDHFVYNAGDAAADPLTPSLLLLPHCYVTYVSENEGDCSMYPGWGRDAVCRQLQPNDIGIIRRRGEDEVVVAELRMVEMSEDTEKTEVAELFLFRSGAWSVMRLLNCCSNEGEPCELPSDWRATTVIAIRDRILCWANEVSDNAGVLMCNVLEEIPWLQYLPLPSVPTPCFSRKVSTTAGGDTLKFVNISPRCCCGGAGTSNCQSSQHAYTIKTWTLRMDDGMEWVMDGIVDATELWSLDTYKGLPRVPLGYPVVVSMYEPHVICFTLCEIYHVKYGGHGTLWLLLVNIRSKRIQSISRHPDWTCYHDLISSNVSYYLNPNTTCSSDGSSMDDRLTSEMDIMKKRELDGMNSMLKSPCKSYGEPAAQAYDEVLAAFREIPNYGLARDDMLKAYAMLSNDNGCRVRSLLRLTMKSRKDWLLMEIKADDG